MRGKLTDHEKATSPVAKPSTMAALTDMPTIAPTDCHQRLSPATDCRPPSTCRQAAAWSGAYATRDQATCGGNAMSDRKAPSCGLEHARWGRCKERTLLGGWGARTGQRCTAHHSSAGEDLRGSEGHRRRRGSGHAAVAAEQDRVELRVGKPPAPPRTGSSVGATTGWVVKHARQRSHRGPASQPRLWALA